MARGRVVTWSDHGDSADSGAPADAEALAHPVVPSDTEPSADTEPTPDTVMVGEPSADDTADPVIARIRAAVRAVDGIADHPLAEHADVYAAVHTQLQGELAEIDGASPG